jgi:hypothetical protein
MESSKTANNDSQPVEGIRTALAYFRILNVIAVLIRSENFDKKTC